MKEFEVYIPTHMYNVYLVRAKTKKEALKKVQENDGSVEQLCQDNCPPGKKNPIVLETKNSVEKKAGEDA